MSISNVLLLESLNFNLLSVAQLCDLEFGIRHQFLAKYTPQSNDLVERRNRTLIDMARSMLSEYNVSQSFGPKLSTWLAIVATASIITH